MKTIKDLRDLIEQNGGSIKIGSLSIESCIGDKKTDIDFKISGELLSWITSSVEDDVLLNDVIDSVSSDFTDIKTKLQEKNSIIKEKDNILKEQEGKITSLETKNKEQGYHLGKIEAYEKILLDKNITITK